MTGTELPLLEDKLKRSMGGKHPADPIGLVADNDNHTIADNGFGRLHHVMNHRPPQHFVQDLGHVGFHARAQAGSQYDGPDSG